MCNVCLRNNNQSLWTQYMVPEIVLEMHRNVVANRLATSGSTWSDLFQRWNSGVSVLAPCNGVPQM
jgi:hypothetical protein